MGKNFKLHPSAFVYAILIRELQSTQSGLKGTCLEPHNNKALPSEGVINTRDSPQSENKGCRKRKSKAVSEEHCSSKLSCMEWPGWLLQGRTITASLLPGVRGLNRNPQLRKRTTEKMAWYVLHVTLLILLPSDLPAKMERNDAMDIDFQGYCTRNQNRYQRVNVIGNAGNYGKLL